MDTIGLFGDIDNDGDFDLIQANLAHPFFIGFPTKVRSSMMAKVISMMKP